MGTSKDGPRDASLFELYSAGAIMSAPITAYGKRLGVLVVCAPQAPVFADSVGAGLSQAVGPLARATSLDNTIRYAAATQSEWVLVDVHAHAAADGYAYGDVHLFSENGTLLATGSQTCVARVLP